MQSRLQPAVFGGLLMGVLSALPFVNVCCCLWMIAGGVLTAYLLQDRTPMPLNAGDGAVAGLLAGVFGALIGTVLGATVGAVMGTDIQGALDQIAGTGDIPPEMTAFFDRLRSVPSVVFFLVSLLFALVLYPLFGMLGGLLGVAIFKKQAPPPGTTEVLPPM